LAALAHAYALSGKKAQAIKIRDELDRGADPDKAGAAWATPLAWACKRGHAEIEADLNSAIS
jgi:hypothetical protein